ncbi:MAG: aminoglycoside phosphotransferase family protein [Aquabacterium sp.]
MSHGTTSTPSSPAATAAGTTAREQALEQWLASLAAQHGLTLATRRPASEDASFRRYWRVDGAGRSWIVMDAPPPLEDVRAFVDVAGRLQAAGLPAPRVHACDAASGFVLLDDLGPLPLMAALRGADPARTDQLMGQAIALLVRLQAGAAATGLPEHDATLMRAEMALFPQWCVQQEHGRTWSAVQQRSWDAVCEALVQEALAQPRCLVHSDYMPRNLMCVDGGLAMLDFQDAVRGAVTYDIASLLRDAFVSWDEEREIDWAIRWWQSARGAGVLGDHPMAGDFGACWRAIEWMGLQRHLRIMGVFCRLKHRDGKPHYSDDLPRFFGYAARTASRYRELKPLVPLLEDLVGPLTATGFSMR